MIKMNITKVDRNNDNTPILSNKEIDDFAYAVLEDYSPNLLRDPGTLDYEHFIESYLGMEIIYKDIYYKENTPPVYSLIADNLRFRLLVDSPSRLRPQLITISCVSSDSFEKAFVQ